MNPRAVLVTKARVEGIDLPIDVADYLAAIPGTDRDREGAMVRVIANASIYGVPVTMDLAREVLEQ